MVLLIAAGGYSCTTGAAETKKEDKPNIVVILVDDLGWKDIGVYGSPFHETPNIDKLSREGMMFTDAYAASAICSPSRASILTGKYPARLQLTDWIPGRQHKRGPDDWNTLTPPDFEQQLALEEVTLAEALKEADYSTGFFGKWHLGEEKFYPEHQGFDVNKGGWAAGNPRSAIYEGGGGYFSPYGNPKLENGPDGEYLTDRLTSESINFMKENKDKPFLVYLSYYSVHTPMEAKEDYIEKYEQKAKNIPPVNATGPRSILVTEEARARSRLIQDHPIYAGMVQSLDEGVGRVLESLQELGLDENTIVIFTSDHGGLSTGRNAVTSSFPLKGGKGWLHEGGSRVPLIIKWPGETKPRSVSETPVILTDIYPTLLELTGQPLKPEQHQDGLSLVPLLKGESELERDTFYWHYPHYSNHHSLPPGGAIRKGNYKLIEYYDDFEIELYNLSVDIGETENLAEKEPEKGKELQQILRDWRESVNAQMPSSRKTD